jgi:hypothetical protein
MSAILTESENITSDLSQLSIQSASLPESNIENQTTVNAESHTKDHSSSVSSSKEIFEILAADKNDQLESSDNQENGDISSSATTTKAAASAVSAKKPLKSMDSFSWSEAEWVVKIYVDFEGAGDLDDSAISFVSSFVMLSVCL